jgi:hypothetical protein
MNATRNFIITIKGRKKPLGYLTDTGIITSDAKRAWIFAGISEAEAALARSRRLLPSARWRVAEADENHAMPLVRSG